VALRPPLAKGLPVRLLLTQIMTGQLTQFNDSERTEGGINQPATTGQPDTPSLLLPPPVVTVSDKINPQERRSRPFRAAPCSAPKQGRSGTAERQGTGPERIAQEASSLGAGCTPPEAATSPDYSRFASRPAFSCGIEGHIVTLRRILLDSDQEDRLLLGQTSSELSPTR
jgi:hypothetical protein